MKTLAVACLLFVTPLVVTRAEAPASEGYRPAIKAELLALTDRTVADQPVVYPSTTAPEVRILRVTIPPGAETGWHKHPYPGYAYLLQGALTLEMEGREPKVLRAGDALVESVNFAHNGRNHGSEPAMLVLVVTAEKGQPTTVPVPAPAR